MAAYAMIDLHAHILPALDDGPADTDQAIAMARVAVEAGTRVMATTCHVNRASGLEADDIDAARAQLSERLGAHGIPLQLVAGAEVSTGRLREMSADSLRRLALGGGPWVLLECPFAHADMEMHVAEVQRRGLEVLLAHPERSASFQRDPARLGALVQRGALAQVTASAFAGEFGGLPQRTAQRMLEAGWIHVLASDGHDPVGRPPDLTVALGPLEQRYGDMADQLRWMAETAPAALLAGERPQDRPPLPRPRGLRRIRLRSSR